MQNSNERRSEILAILNIRRYEKIDNLAFEFNVSRRTIINDINSLSLLSPIYTVSGKYGGGVYVLEGCSAGRKYLSDKQAELLKRLLPKLRADDAETMRSILKSFAVPEKGKRRE